MKNMMLRDTLTGDQSLPYEKAHQDPNNVKKARRSRCDYYIVPS